MAERRDEADARVAQTAVTADNNDPPACECLRRGRTEHRLRRDDPVPGHILTRCVRAAGQQCLHPLDPGSLNRTPVGDICFYLERPTRALITGNASVTLVRGPTARTVYETERTRDPGATDVPGVGDRAFLVLSDTQSAVIALRGDATVAVDITHATGSRPSDVEVRERLLTLMRTVLSRL